MLGVLHKNQVVITPGGLDKSLGEHIDKVGGGGGWKGGSGWMMGRPRRYFSQRAAFEGRN